MPRKSDSIVKFLLLAFLFFSLIHGVYVDLSRVYGDTTSTGILGNYEFNEGEFKGIIGWPNYIKEYVDRPEAHLSFVSEGNGSIFFTLNPSDGPQPHFQTRYTDVTRFGYTTGPGGWDDKKYWQLFPGIELEIVIYPDIYDGYMGDEYEYQGETVHDWWYKFHTQLGSLEYELTYTSIDTGGDTGGGDTFVEADFIIEPLNPSTMDTVTVTSNCRVEGGDITSYRWYIDEEMLYSVEDAESWNWEKPEEGTYVITLEVTDSNGNEDSYWDYLTITGGPEWYIIDAEVCQNVEQRPPYDPIGLKSSFTYGDNIFVWFKLGDVIGSHPIGFEWVSPKGEIAHSYYTEIPDPETQGLYFYESYVLWDGVIPENAYDYNLVFRDPGDWMVHVYLDHNIEYTYGFDITGDITLEATVQKTKFTTGETIEVTGSLGFGGAPIASSKVRPEVWRGGQLFETLPDIDVASNGGFTLSYVVPKVLLSLAPSGPEDWEIKLTSIIEGYESVEKSIDVKVLPLWLSIKEVKLVQVVEVPVYTDWGGSYPYFAKDRDACARIYLEWRGYQTGFKTPQVPLEFSMRQVYKDNTVTQSIYAELESEEKAVDVFFTLSDGKYLLKAQIDPRNTLLSRDSSPEMKESLEWEDEVISKEMEKVEIEFLPIELSLSTPQEVSDYVAFAKRQQEFMEDVYPLPESKLSFKVSQNSWNVPDALEKKWGLLTWASETYYLTMKKYRALGLLALDNFMTGKKTVGVLPRSNNWWNPDEEGFASGRLIKGAVMVQYNAPVGVTAHEIAHTYGLNLWREEYNIYTSKDYPGSGKEISMLILKDGKIYDLSIPTQSDWHPNDQLVDKERAFGWNTAHVFCFMGNNIHETWICDETYKELFTALKDPIQECLFVRGVAFDNGTVVAEPWFRGEAEPDIMNTGDYVIRCLSSTGKLLYNGSFGTLEPVAPFAFTIPYPDGVSRVEILKDDVVLYSTSASPSQPTVSSVSLTQIDQDTMQVNWSGSDADGDELTYLILFSPDNGASWDTVVYESTENQETLDLSKLPGGADCRIQVVVTDGINTGAMVSQSFASDNKSPIAGLIQPVLDETYYIGDLIEFEGAAYDLEDSEVSRILWYSDIDGLIGGGEELQTTLGIGVHTITLVAEDSNGAQAEVSTVINVIDRPAVGLLDHILCKGIMEDGTPVDITDVYQDDENIISLVTVSNAVPGDTIYWSFGGPVVNEEFSYVIDEAGDTGAYASLDLSGFNPVDMVGDWSVQVSINDEAVSTVNLVVEERQEPLGGFAWWGGFIGLAIIIGLAGGGYMLLKRRKKSGAPQVEVQTPVVQRGKQRFCSDCGQTATWIEQYQRWYCYNCEKYLE